MTGTGEVACNPTSKAILADPVSVVGPSRARAALVEIWKWLTQHGRDVIARGVSRRLKIAETISLGEKRFISILQVDGEQFLIGGSASNIVLLAKMEAKAELPGRMSFESVLSAEFGPAATEAVRTEFTKVAR